MVHNREGGRLSHYLGRRRSQWTPPGKPRNLHYRFCTTCGDRAFAQGEQDAIDGRLLRGRGGNNEADPDELADLIKYVDGRHDHYDKTPVDTRYL